MARRTKRNGVGEKGLGKIEGSPNPAMVDGDHVVGGRMRFADYRLLKKGDVVRVCNEQTISACGGRIYVRRSLL